MGETNQGLQARYPHLMKFRMHTRYSDEDHLPSVILDWVSGHWDGLIDILYLHIAVFFVIGNLVWQATCWGLEM